MKKQILVECHQQDSRLRIVGGGTVNQTLSGNMAHDALNGGMVLEVIPLEHNPSDSRLKYARGGQVQTLTARAGTGGNNVPLIMEAKMDFTMTTGNFTQVEADKTPTLMARDWKDPTIVAQDVSYSMGHEERSASFTPNKTDPLTATDYKQPSIVNQQYVVRRLTPTECERLQGLPDGYTDVPGATDSKRYKAIGNGMASPCADYVIAQIVKAMRETE